MNISETQKMAEDLAFTACNHARIFALVGDLGAGKTTFSRFFLRALGVTEPITSPTFVIMKNYPLSDARFSRVCHVDCYRLKNPEEIAALGFVDVLADEKTIIFIEWADRIAGMLPENTVWIDFAHAGEGDRVITVRKPL